VISERRGQSIFYSLAPDAADRLGAISRGLIPGGLVTVGELVAGRAKNEPAPLRGADA
jgi:hypothetical protein